MSLDRGCAAGARWWPLPRKPVALCVALACVLTGCSPYMFSSDVQSFSTKVSSIDASYKMANQQIAAEKQLADRIVWVRDRTHLTMGPGCNLDSTDPSPCELVAWPAPAAKPVPAVPAKPAPPDICPAPAAPSPAMVSERAATLKPLQRANLLNAFDNYAAALAAVTKASDRAAFDTASAKLSAAVGSLTQSAAGLTGAGAAGTLAKATTDMALWLVGQSLDYQRLEELRRGTEATCEPVHVLAKALGVVLKDQRGIRLSGLQDLITLRVNALDRARVNKKTSDAAYGSLIDDAESAVGAYQMVRATDPMAAAEALSNAHDALVLAVRNNTGESAALVASLQSFAQKADALAAAAAAIAAPAKKP